MFQLSPSRLSLALLSGVLVVAFTSTPAVAQYTHRLTRVVYDFDANGVADADSNLVYDPAGRVVSSDYTYFGDGTPDLFNTVDDEISQEDSLFGYDASGRLTSGNVDRGFELFETETFFVGDRFDQVFLVERDGSGGVVNDVRFDFGYTGGNLTEVLNRDNTDESLIFTLGISYDAEGLPQQSDLLSLGVDFSNIFTVDDGGNVTAIDSSAGAFGSGSATMTYLPAPSGQLEHEVWTETGTIGSLFSEFPGFDYRKTYAYDGNDLRTHAEVDIGDDGSVEAIVTFEWLAASCNPVFQWAPNGRPNFSATPADPSMVPSVYVPGTGATYTENCGPFPVPEPSFAWGLLVGVGALAGGRVRRAPISEAQRSATKGRGA